LWSAEFTGAGKEFAPRVLVYGPLPGASPAGLDDPGGLFDGCNGASRIVRKALDFRLVLGGRSWHDQKPLGRLGPVVWAWRCEIEAYAARESGVRRSQTLEQAT
jgi:hypothetical protein